MFAGACALQEPPVEPVFWLGLSILMSWGADVAVATKLILALSSPQRDKPENKKGPSAARFQLSAIFQIRDRRAQSTKLFP
jgi:hypothetical protein